MSFKFVCEPEQQKKAVQTFKTEERRLKLNPKVETSWRRDGLELS